MDRAILVASTFCFLLGFAYTMFALGAGRYRPSWFNFSAIMLGFVGQTIFLWLRGDKLGSCPLTNLFEVFIFLSWSVVLFYLVVGTTYRMSLLGAFTSPLVFVFQSFALLAPIDSDRHVRLAPNAWLELHAAVSIIAYGAFALAGVASVMYLVQERQLKTHHIHSFFFALPPIADLAVVIKRLIFAGLSLLTFGLASGFVVRADWVKVSWGIGVWLLYGGILGAAFGHRVSPRRVALLSLCAFMLTLSTLWGINFLTGSRS